MIKEQNLKVNLLTFTPQNYNIPFTNPAISQNEQSHILHNKNLVNFSNKNLTPTGKHLDISNNLTNFNSIHQNKKNNLIPSNLLFSPVIIGNNFKCLPNENIPGFSSIKTFEVSKNNIPSNLIYFIKRQFMICQKL